MTDSQRNKAIRKAEFVREYLQQHSSLTTALEAVQAFDEVEAGKAVFARIKRQNDALIEARRLGIPLGE